MLGFATVVGELQHLSLKWFEEREDSKIESRRADIRRKIGAEHRSFQACTANIPNKPEACKLDYTQVSCPFFFHEHNELRLFNIPLPTGTKCYYHDALHVLS